MTEQIERDLAELFHDRAERLDVLPPLPAARVRRARLQASLAMASVVAVLAAAGVAGVRLSSGPGGGQVSFAGSGSAQADLERDAQKMMAGRWRVVMTVHNKPSDTSAPLAALKLDAEWDGVRKVGIGRENGTVVAIQVDGVSYVPVLMSPEIARYLPKTARWQRVSKPMMGVDPIANVIGLPRPGSGSSDAGSSEPGGATTEPSDAMTVWRTSAGFAIDSHGSFGTSHTDVVLRADHTISSVHTVSQRPTEMNGVKTTETDVTDAVFSRLTAPLHVAVPDPATIVTEPQFQAAIEKSMRVGTAQPPCPPSGLKPTITKHQVTPGGSVSTTQSMTVFSCPSVMTGTMTLTPAASPSPH